MKINVIAKESGKATAGTLFFVKKSVQFSAVLSEAGEKQVETVLDGMKEGPFEDLEYLEIDENDPKSSKDFGKNVIPNLLRSGERLYAYPFSGYWKDVGTIGSLWEANMDLLAEKPELDLRQRFFRIYSRNSARSPQFIGKTASIQSSMISEGCSIYGTVKHSVISGGSVIGQGAEICNSVIMDDVVVEPGAKVYYSIVDRETVIRSGVTVGDPNAGKNRITVIAKGSDVTENVEGTVETK